MRYLRGSARDGEGPKDTGKADGPKAKQRTKDQDNGQLVFNETNKGRMDMSDVIWLIIGAATGFAVAGLGFFALCGRMNDEGDEHEDSIW